MIKLFISYSHEDEDLRDELEVHLSGMRRQGLIEVWHDRRIVAGSPIGREIDERLEGADIVLLLVSAYFLDSDYCYEREMLRAIERHEEGSCVVIPVILHPCDWHSAPFGDLRATPTDGRPVSMHANKHESFAIVAADIRTAAEQLGKATTGRDEASAVVTSRPADQPRSSNLRVKRSFSDHDRDAFRDSAFEYIATFFENSLAELSLRNETIETRYQRIDGNSMSAVAYIDGERRSGCRIWVGSSGAFSGDIAYSNNEASTSTSFNDSMQIVDDGYSLGLMPMGMASYAARPQDQLTMQGAAEHFWEVFIRPLQ